MLQVTPIIRKEFLEIRRDARQLIVLIFMPTFLLLLVGYALNFDVKHVRLAVYDEDKSSQSREFIGYLHQSEYIDYIGAARSPDEAERYIDAGIAHLVIRIPSGFSESAQTGKAARVQILIEGSNANTASIAMNYAQLGIQSYSMKLAAEWVERHGRSFQPPIDVQPRFLYNPELKSAKYLVPGLFGIILMIVTVISTALSVVREKESGTMEQLKNSPIHSYAIIIGKIVPYFIIAFLAATLILLVGYLLFDVEVKGNLLLLYSTISIFLIAGLGQGLLISTLANTQQVAFLASVFTSLLPSFLLSGFVFPISSMPIVLQIISNLFPVTFFLQLMRSIILKGTGIAEIWEPLLALIAYTIVIVGASSLRLRKELAT